MRSRGILFGLTATFSVVFGFFTFRNHPEQAVAIVRNAGYWEILTVAALFAWCLGRSLRADVRATLASKSAWLGPVLLVVFAAAFLHIQERHEYKILMDEIVLQNTAKMMHFEREAAVTVRGYDVSGNFTPLVVFVDKRPLFFPFLLATLHDLTGYRIANVFVLNALLSVALVGLTFLVGRRAAGFAGGLAAVALLISVPLVHQNATGGGFELLNLVMIVATLWLGMRFAERPDTPRLGAFLLSGILLAQTRYESGLFILPVGLTILFVWWKRRAADFAWPIIVAPLLLTIVPLHFNVFKLAQASWQLSDIQGSDVPFSLTYYYDNVGHALNFMFSQDGSQPNSIWVSALGILGVGFLMLQIYRTHRELIQFRPAEVVLVLFLLGLAVHTVMMLCYFWGKFDDQVVTRLSLPMHLLFIFAFVYVYPNLVPWRLRWPALVGGTALFLIGVTIPAAAMHRYDESNFAARSNNWISHYIQDLGDESALVVDSNFGIQWFLYDKSSIAVEALAISPEKYLFNFRNRTFKNFLVVQRLGSSFEDGSRFPSVGDDIGDAFTLETLAETSMSPIYHVRISRVVDVDEEKLKAWAGERLGKVELTPEIRQQISEDGNRALDTWFKMLP